MRYFPNRWMLITAFLPAISGLHAADVASDFSTGNEGWVVVDHVFDGTVGFPNDLGIDASNLNPMVISGELQVDDLGGEWAWAIAPAKFSGDWTYKASVQADFTAAAEPVAYPVMFWISDGRSPNGTNAAYHLFPQAMTVSGQTTNYFVSLQPADWTVTGGKWTNLVKNVQEFWIRTDVTPGCTGTDCSYPETDFLDNVILKTASLGPLRITNSIGMVLLDWTGGADISLQKSTNLTLSAWQTISETIGASHFQELITNKTVFYRLIQ